MCEKKGTSVLNYNGLRSQFSKRLSCKQVFSPTHKYVSEKAEEKKWTACDGRSRSGIQIGSARPRRAVWHETPRRAPRTTPGWISRGLTEAVAENAVKSNVADASPVVPLTP